jgi:hypothetical protein
VALARAHAARARILVVDFGDAVHERSGVHTPPLRTLRLPRLHDAIRGGYCLFILLFALGNAHGAAFVAYVRLSGNAALISCIWAALGFTCGLEPGKLRHKLVLLTAIVSIMLLRLAIMLRAVPNIDPELLTPLGIRADAATEVVGALILTSSLQAHIISPTVGFVVGLQVLHTFTQLNERGVRLQQSRDELAHSLSSSRSQVLGLLRRLPVQREYKTRGPAQKATKVQYSHADARG